MTTPELIADLAALNSLGLEPNRLRYLRVKLLRAEQEERRLILLQAQDELRRNTSRTQRDYTRQLQERKAYGERHPKKK